MKIQGQVGVCYILAVGNAFDIPEGAVEGIADLTEMFCKTAELTGVVVSPVNGDVGEKGYSVFRS